MRTWKRFGKVVLRIAQGLLALVGLMACAHLIGLASAHPLVRLAQVDGISMEPTLHNGQQVLFARLPWHEGSIVLADPPDDGLVVKRVERCEGGQIFLRGDNREMSAVYEVPPDRLVGTMLCCTPFHSPMPPPEEDPAQTAQ